MNKTQEISFSENKPNLLLSSKLLWVTLFAVAMGMLESSVVIYLRELYYPAGFKFPLHATSYTVAVTELFRELSTLIMLLGIGMLAGKNKHERFAWFIYSFAIWDIFYYVFLYLLINWPVTLFDWDVLFLLPIFILIDDFACTVYFIFFQIWKWRKSEITRMDAADNRRINCYYCLLQRLLSVYDHPIPNHSGHAALLFKENLRICRSICSFQFRCTIIPFGMCCYLHRNWQVCD